MASYIGQAKIGEVTYPIGSMLYGTCSTAASTAAKVVTLAAFDTLATGITVQVKFSTANTAANPTLKVGSTTAKSITNPNGRTTWAAGAVIAFTYDGTNWVMNSTAVPAGANVSDSAESGKYVSAVSQSDGAISVTRESFNPILSYLAPTGSNAEKLAVTIANGSSSLHELSKATTSLYGVTILSDSTSSTSTTSAATAKSVKTAYDLANGKQDPITFNTAYNATSNKAATMADITSAVSGLTGAMHFIGITSTAVTDGGTEDPTIDDVSVTTKNAGDVVIYDHQEYVWNGSAWELLGDEGSYALKTSTADVLKTATLTKNTLPELTITNTSIPNVTSVGTAPSLTKSDVSIPNVTNAGAASTFDVASGTLTITPGTAPTLGTALSATKISAWNAGSTPTLGTAISVGSASGWSAGTQASLSTTTQTVVKP